MWSLQCSPWSGQARSNQFIRAFYSLLLSWVIAFLPSCFTWWKMTSKPGDSMAKSSFPSVAHAQKTLLKYLFSINDSNNVWAVAVHRVIFNWLDQANGSHTQAKHRQLVVVVLTGSTSWVFDQLTGAGKVLAGAQLTSLFVLAPLPVLHHLHLAWNVSLCSIW